MLHPNDEAARQTEAKKWCAVRAGKGRDCLRRVSGKVQLDIDDLAYTLVNLRHWCDANNIDFHLAISKSYLQYLEDKKD